MVRTKHPSRDEVSSQQRIGPLPSWIGKTERKPSPSGGLCGTKCFPWIVACVCGIIGIILGSSHREGSFIAGVCGAGGYLLGAMIRAAANRSADKLTRGEGTEYSPQEWQDYKNKLKDRTETNNHG